MSGRGRNPSRPNNSGFKVIPAHAPHSAYLGKAKKLKESLIERAKIKKSFAKTLKKEGLSSDRLVRGADGTIIGGSRGGASGISGRGRGRGRGRGGSIAGAGASGRGGGRGGRSGPINDGARELARQTIGSSKSKPTSTATPVTTKQPPPESESDESELESGEERPPRPSKRQSSSHAKLDADEDADSDDGFFDDDPNGENTIDSRLSLDKGKGRARVDRLDDDDDESRPRESRERSRAGPAPGSDPDDDDDHDSHHPSTSTRLPYTRPSATRGGRGTSPSSTLSTRGRPSQRGKFGASAASSTVHNPGTSRPWGTNPEAGTTTRPKGKKDASNPNFTFLGGAGGDDLAGQNQSTKFKAGGRRERSGEAAASMSTPTLPLPSDMPFRGKPLHSHKITSSPASLDPTTASTLRDLKRSAYLGLDSRAGMDVHPGRTKRVMANARKQAVAGSNLSTTAVIKPKDASASTTPAQRGRPDSTKHSKPNSYPHSNPNASYRNTATNTNVGRRQPRLGARMGALLQEIERRGV